MIISSTGLFPNLRLGIQQWESMINSWNRRRDIKGCLPKICNISVRQEGVLLFLLLSPQLSHSSCLDAETADFLFLLRLAHVKLWEAGVLTEDTEGEDIQ